MIENIKNEVLSFLASDKPGVIVIKGDWGTGKTYAWNMWLKEAVVDENISSDKYSYISLFGCNSLDELKAQTFQEMIPVDLIPQGVSFETVTENIRDVAEKKDWKSLLPFTANITKKLNDLPFVRNYSVDLWRLGWLTIKGALVCIDDVERVGKNLRVKDVYGLVSVLKEQKNCKIVLILNDESIEGDNKKDYEDYREKVVDVELHFDPETKDLVELVFDRSYSHFNKIQSCICNLKVKNVRTIQKIKMYLDKLAPYLKDVEDAYYENVINSIVLFTVLYFSKPDKWPTLDEVLEANTEKFSVVEYALNKKDADIQGVTTEWAQKMNLLKTVYKSWGGSDEIDQLLGAYVKQGYIEPDILQELIEKSSEDTEKIKLDNKARELHGKVGEILLDTFDDNLSDLISAMENSLQTSVQLSPSITHLNNYIRILRDIGQNDEADKLIQKYIGWAEKQHSNRLKLDSVNTSFSGPLDKKLIAEISKAFEKLRKVEIVDLLKTVDRSKRIREAAERCPDYRLTEGDYEILSYFDQKDFEQFLRNAEVDRSVRDFLEIFLTRPTINSCLSYHAKIQAMVVEAVKNIARESKLNEYRLKRYLDQIKAIEAQEEAA